MTFACWKCDAEIGAEVACPACGALQPVRGEPELFGALGVEPSMRPDLETLRIRFHELSRRFHPDYFQNADAFERECAEEQSELVNRAWRLLKDEDSRRRYLLEREGLVGENVEPPKPDDPEFLMEMMEIQEEIEDARTAPADHRDSLRGRREDLEQRDAREQGLIGSLMDQWDQGGERAVLSREMLAAQGRRNYYERLLRTINEILQAA